MTNHPEIEFATPAERLSTLAHLVELALFAPEGEVTFDGRAAIQRAAREIVILASEVAASPQNKGLGTPKPVTKKTLRT